jgi:hypothetical protein
MCFGCVRPPSNGYRQLKAWNARACRRCETEFEFSAEAKQCRYGLHRSDSPPFTPRLPTNVEGLRSQVQAYFSSRWQFVWSSRCQHKDQWPIAALEAVNIALSLATTGNYADAFGPGTGPTHTPRPFSHCRLAFYSGLSEPAPCGNSDGVSAASKRRCSRAVSVPGTHRR